MTSFERTSKKELCKKLDVTLLDIFDCIEDILRYQHELEAILSDGYFLMSKARYSMGAQSISELQYNIDDLREAKIRVHSSNDDSDWPQLSTLTGSKDTDVNIVRKRTVAAKESNEGLDTKSLAGSDYKDPIKWFGILVPQPLRQSQQKFSAAAELSVHIANAKLKLAEYVANYKNLHQAKRKLVSSQKTETDDLAGSNNDSFEDLGDDGHNSEQNIHGDLESDMCNISLHNDGEIS